MNHLTLSKFVGLTFLASLVFSFQLSAQPTDPPPPPPDDSPPGDPPTQDPTDPPTEDPGTAPEVWAVFQSISTRALIDNENFVDGGQNFGIINTSVIIGGEAGSTQTVVWRGRGPSLNLAEGAVGAEDMLLEVVKPGEGLLKTNENFTTDDQFDLIDGTFLVPPGIQENEGIATTLELEPGPFSVRVRSDGVSKGIGQGEAFAFFTGAAQEPSAEPPVQLTGISTRAPVGAGIQETMNTNFIIVGPGLTSVVCRGRGPSINLPASVAKLANPVIELIKIGEGLIASNSSYLETDDLDLIEGTEFIPPGIQDNEAIIVALNLEPGAYTVRLSDGDGGEGIGIAEAFIADL